MAARSSILTWRIPWTGELGGLQTWGHKESEAAVVVGYYGADTILDLCWGLNPLYCVSVYCGWESRGWNWRGLSSKPGLIVIPVFREL